MVILLLYALAPILVFGTHFHSAPAALECHHACLQLTALDRAWKAPKSLGIKHPIKEP